MYLIQYYDGRKTLHNSKEEVLDLCESRIDEIEMIDIVEVINLSNNGDNQKYAIITDQTFDNKVLSYRSNEQLLSYLIPHADKILDFVRV